MSSAVLKTAPRSNINTETSLKWVLISFLTDFKIGHKNSDKYELEEIAYWDEDYWRETNFVRCRHKNCVEDLKNGVYIGYRNPPGQKLSKWAVERHEARHHISAETQLENAQIACAQSIIINNLPLDFWERKSNKEAKSIGRAERYEFIIKILFLSIIKRCLVCLKPIYG